MKTAGWTLDQTKRTDYILYYWEPTKRAVLYPFHPLMWASVHNIDNWWAKGGKIAGYKHVYGKTPINNGFYFTDCVAVPRLEVERAIAAEYISSPALV